MDTAAIAHRFAVSTFRSAKRAARMIGHGDSDSFWRHTAHQRLLIALDWRTLSTAKPSEPAS